MIGIFTVLPPVRWGIEEEERPDPQPVLPIDHVVVYPPVAPVDFDKEFRPVRRHAPKVDANPLSKFHVFTNPLTGVDT
jgi:hypothetical protein